MLAVTPCALPAGQRCFTVHQQRSARPGRPQAAYCSSGAGSGADAAPADRRAGSSSKRSLLLGAAGLLAAGPLLGLPAAAEEAVASSSSGSGSRRVFFDISVDRFPFGRVVVEVPASAPKIGGQRFLDLAQVRWVHVWVASARSAV